jgi:hypothetical protein
MFIVLIIIASLIMLYILISDKVQGILYVYNVRYLDKVTGRTLIKEGFTRKKYIRAFIRNNNLDVVNVYRTKF